MTNGYYMGNLRFSQRRFRSSGMRRSVAGLVVFDVSKGRSAFTFKGLRVQEDV